VAAFVVVAVLAMLVTSIVLLWRPFVRPVILGDRCTATAGDQVVHVDLDQAQNASVIVAESVRRGLPARAATIALAAAYQESDLHNLAHGDRDSLGLFQQRPSQGWGTPTQVQDPRHATAKFYDALQKIDGYREMAVTVAAQRVQRSAFPTAYADHEADARVLASALTGNSHAAFSCRVRSVDAAVETPTASGLTPRAQAVRTDLVNTFGRQPMGGFAPGGVNNGHIAGSAHYDGRAIDVLFRPVTVDQQRRGWATAQYLVANAERLRVATVIYDDRIWSARRSADGWRPYVPPAGATANPVLRHLDHVHVDVLRGG
jgi:hypothetical protein